MQLEMLVFFSDKMLEVSSGILVELPSCLPCFFSDSTGTGSSAANWSLASRPKDLSFKFVGYQGLVRTSSPLEDGGCGLGCNL